MLLSMTASKCRTVGCVKGLGPTKIRDDVHFCDQHMPGARQCLNSKCKRWLRRLNATGYCYLHRNETQRSAGNRERHHSDPRRRLLAQARYRAKRKHIPFDLVPADLFVPTHCPVLGTHLDFSGDRSTYPSLDRIRPERGYIRGNVWVISARANSMKWDATMEELLTFSRFWVDQWGEYVREANA